MLKSGELSELNLTKTALLAEYGHLLMPACLTKGVDWKINEPFGADTFEKGSISSYDGSILSSAPPPPHTHTHKTK